MCKTPCNECPFRKNSIPGWLGPHKIEDFRTMASADVDFKCHMELDTLGDEANTCGGYIYWRLNSFMMAKDPYLKNLEWIAKTNKEERDKCLGLDFVKYHKKSIDV